MTVMVMALALALEDNRFLPALTAGVLGVVFLVSSPSRGRPHVLWLAGSAVLYGIQQAFSVLVTALGYPSSEVQELLLPLSFTVVGAALSAGLITYFVPGRLAPTNLFFGLVALSGAGVVVGYLNSNTWAFSGAAVISGWAALISLGLWLLSWKTRCWGKALLGGVFSLMPLLFFGSLWAELSLSQYREIVPLPLTLIYAALAALLLLHDTSTLRTQLDERLVVEKELLALKESLELQVVSRTAALSDIVEGLRAFSAMVSHDLRAPVRNVSGLAEMGLQDFRAGRTDCVEELFRLIGEEAARGTAMMNDLLKLARVDVQPLSFRESDIGALVQECVDDLTMQYPLARQVVEVQALPTLVVDVGLLHHAVTNILGNALKFGQGNEDLKISVSAARSAENKEWRFEIKDNGPGFDPALAGKLFEPFSRLPSNDATGTGLGLTVFRRVVERHNGNVGAAARLGHGATFWWTLPETIEG